MTSLSIYSCSKEVARYLVRRHHYAGVGRLPSIWHCFGLREGNRVVGTCLFSKPASYTLCIGVCGEEFRKYVLELSRLVITTPTANAGSWFVSRCLKELGDAVVVSYADCNDHVGHVGYVYQACNFLYTGASAREPAWVDPRTGEVISYTRRRVPKKARRLGLHWRDLVQRKQKGKHRYVYFTGNRRFVRKACKALKYPVLPYPKGDTGRHEIDRIGELAD